VGDIILRKVPLATRNPTEGKLGSNSERSYWDIDSNHHGTNCLETLDRKVLPHPWNAKHLKKYYKCNVYYIFNNLIKVHSLQHLFVYFKIPIGNDQNPNSTRLTS